MSLWSQPVGSPTSRPVAALDGAVDGAVVAFALWTLWYEVALWARLSLWTPAALWLVLAVACVLGGAAWAVRRTTRARDDLLPEPSRGADPAPSWPADRGWAVAAVAVLLTVAVAARTVVGVLPVALVALAVLGAQVVAHLRAGRAVPTTPSKAPTTPSTAASVPSTAAHGIAALVSAGLAVLASLLVDPDPDDVFYVNRSTWVAVHGVPALRDTMFGAGTYPSTYGGGLPLSSVESLLGALAHLAHLQAGTVVYLLVPPVAAFLSGWATWRLVRAWAPRRALLVLLVTVVFTLLSADSILGNFSLGRLWQGKVIAECVLVPLIWCYLSALVERHSRTALLLLLAAGTCFVGLTPAAALIAPVVGGASLVAALVLRAGRLAAGGVALMVAPLVSGMVIALGPAAVGGVDPVAPSAASAFNRVLGTGNVLVALSVVGLVLGVRLARGRRTMLVAAGSLATMAALLPGVFELVNAATGAGPVAWRLMVGVPTGVLVGLFAAVQVPVGCRRLSVGGRRVPLVPAAVAVVVAAAVLVAGTPIWSHEAGARLTAHPEWKVRQQALGDVRALAGRHTGPGPWLLPPSRMSVLTIADVRHAAVVPRDFYLTGLQESRGDAAARALLLGLVSGEKPLPTEDVTRQALARLDVALVCVPHHDKALRGYLRDLSRNPPRPAGGLLCGTPDA